MLGDFRAAGIGRRESAVRRGDRAAAAAAERQVIAGGTRLGRLFDIPAKFLKALRPGLGHRSGDARVGFVAGCEGAAGEKSFGLHRREHVTADAALHAEERRRRFGGLVPEDHRRERAVELDADAVAEDELAREREDAFGLLQSELFVEARPASDRLEAQELQLVELELFHQRGHSRHVLIGAAADDAVDADFRLHRTQEAQRSFRVAEAVEPARVFISLANAIDADVDLAEDRAAPGRGFIEPQAAGGQVRGDADLARVIGYSEEIVELQRFAAAERDVEDAHLRKLVEDAAGFFVGQRDAGWSRIDVAALAAGGALPREHDVNFGWRAQRTLGWFLPE